MLFDRLKEPSTYASFASGLIALGISIPEPIISGVSLILAGIASVVGIILKEKK